MDTVKYYAEMLKKAQNKLRAASIKARNYKPDRFADSYKDKLDAEVNRAAADVRTWKERLAKVQ